MIQKLGRILTIALVAFLPWSVIFTVACTERLGFESARYIKELWIICIACIFVFDVWYRKVKIRMDYLDGVVLFYGLILVVISLINRTPLVGIIYGLRYDLLFMIVYVLFRKALPLWGLHIRNIGTIFVISGGLMFASSLIVRYVFGDVFLTFFGFSGQVSVWDGSGPPPIYHGIPGANVARFQGLLEGPNQMAFFLLVYIGAFLTCFYQYKRYRFINIVIILGLLILVAQTYSRSAMTAVFVASLFLLLRYFLQKFRNTKVPFTKRIPWRKVGIVAIILVCIGTALSLQFGPKFAEIIARKGSTSAHFERMYIGYLRFLEHPLGSGLSQAGPASRTLAHVTNDPIAIESLAPEMKPLTEYFLARNKDFVMSTEHYYIPESWHIQQLVEGGIIGFLLYVGFFIFLFVGISRYPYLVATLIGVLVMTSFLHSFESIHTSIAFFILLAATLPIKKNVIFSRNSGNPKSRIPKSK